MMRPSILAGLLGGGIPQIVDLNGSQITDRFNREDSASSLGVATSGQTWVADAGTWGIAGNRAYMVAQSGDSLATINSGLSNIDYSADFVYATDGGIIFRSVDVNNYWLVLLPPATNRLQLYKRTGAASYTQVANPIVSLLPGASYNLRLTANGSAINVYLDDTLVIGPITDATYSTATRVGIRQNATGAQRWMNVLCKPFGAATERRVMTWAGDIHTPGIIRRDTSSQKTFVGWANPNKEVSTLAVGDQWARFANNGATPVNILLDTDFSSDIDDVFDLKAAIAYHAEGLANLIGVAVTTSRSKAPGAAAAMLQYYGIGSIPVASYAPLGTFDPGTPSLTYDAIYDSYPHTGYALAATVTDTTTGIGSWLTASSGNVVYVMTGFAKALRAFLEASPGNLSLFASKVAKVVAVAGLYPNDAGSPEFNFAQNAGDWNWLATNCPVPIVWVGIGIGNAIGNVGSAYLNARQSASDIVRFAVANSIWSASGRIPWGVAGVHYAVEGRSRYFATEVAGTNAINASTGSNTFTAGAGTHSYLTTTMAASLKRHHESLVAADVAQGIKTWSGSAWS